MAFYLYNNHNRSVLSTQNCSGSRQPFNRRCKGLDLGASAHQAMNYGCKSDLWQFGEIQTYVDGRRGEDSLTDRPEQDWEVSICQGCAGGGISFPFAILIPCNNIWVPACSSNSRLLHSWALTLPAASKEPYVNSRIHNWGSIEGKSF